MGGVLTNPLEMAQTHRFDSVQKRDECFVKLLSVAKGRWETA
jgi:hypothetical protein